MKYFSTSFQSIITLTIVLIGMSTVLFAQETYFQTDWVSGMGTIGPLTDWGSKFYQSESINFNISGQISLIATTGSLGHINKGEEQDPRINSVNAGDWAKHIIETNPSIDGHSGIFTADFDGDGDYDLAGAIPGIGIRIYRNQLVETGTVNYIKQTDLSIPVFMYCLLWCGDFDKDGDADIVVPTKSGVYWAENTGDFRFIIHQISTVGYVCPCLDVGDVDNDGDNDIVVGDVPLDFYRNDGSMNFAKSKISAGKWWRVNLGDLNNDGYLDILNGTDVYIYQNGSFPKTPSWSINKSVDGNWIRDFNNDGKKDLLMCLSTGIEWFENDGTGTNYTAHAVFSGSDYNDACIGEDIDLDGKADVVGSLRKIGYLKQISPNSFQEIVVDSLINSSHWCYVANLDYKPCGSDFDLDILASAGSKFSWYENLTQKTRYAPTGHLVSSILEIADKKFWKNFTYKSGCVEGTQMRFYVRSGVTSATIQSNPWRGPFNGVFGQPSGSFDILSVTTPGDHFFQYEIAMAGNGTSSPFVYEVSVNTDTVIRAHITCPANITVSNDQNLCSAVVNYSVTATGYPTPTIVCIPPSGSTFPVGTTNVLCVAKNNLGSDTCNFLITVNDSQAPTITCPANIDTVSDYSDTPVVVNFNSTATDNCPGITIVSNPPTGSTFPVGQTIVQCTATDHAGNKSTCSFTVTIKKPSCQTAVALRDDFNIPSSHGTELLVAGRYKWSHMINHPAGGVMVIKDSVIEPGSRLPLYDYGSIVWDSLVTGGSEASLTIVRKSGFVISKNSFKLNCDTANATLKLYARMDSKDYMAGKGYELRWTEQAGIDRLDIVLVGPQYWRESVLATAKLLINPGDVITFRVECDNRTMVGLVNDVPIVSAIDSTYKPDQWYFVIRACNFKTTAQFDDFKVSQPKNPFKMPQRPLRKIEEMIPGKYALNQNYPNPFNPTTTFRFGIPTLSAVRLEIYNMVGQRIVTLVNEELEEGYYEISWTANITSGIYFYRIESINIAEPNKSFRDVKKLILLK
jgi:hypothetical protein